MDNIPILHIRTDSSILFKKISLPTINVPIKYENRYKSEYDLYSFPNITSDSAINIPLHGDSFNVNVLKSKSSDVTMLVLNFSRMNSIVSINIDTPLSLNNISNFITDKFEESSTIWDSNTDIVIVLPDSSSSINLNVPTIPKYFNKDDYADIGLKILKKEIEKNKKDSTKINIESKLLDNSKKLIPLNSRFASKKIGVL